MPESATATDNGSGVCYDVLTHYPIVIAGRPVGAVVVAMGMSYLIGSFLIIYWIKHQEANARKGSDVVATQAVKSVIFPFFVNVLWANAFVNLYTGIITLTLSISPYELTSLGNWGYIYGYCLMWALQHAVTEGVAFLLMQKGLGKHAGKQTLKWMLMWFLITLGIKLAVYKYADENVYVSFSFEAVWEIALFVFYATLWLTPEKQLFRRPAALKYAMFWTLFRVLTFICTIIYFIPATSSYGFCMIMLGPVFIFAVFEPLIVYYTLLQDSKWWTGTELYHSNRTDSSIQDIRSPLEGIDLNLHSAQSLAASIDNFGNAGGDSKVRLLNFSYINLNRNKQLGTGSFSKVFLGSYRETECAIKLVFTVDLTTDEIHRVWQEAQILSSIKHPNVVSIFGVSVLPPSVCILLELCSFGSLADIIRNTGIIPTGDEGINVCDNENGFSLTRIDRLYLAVGCARGLAALHSINSDLCHRDIKSFNFLVDSQLNAKLADLELGTNKDKNGSIGSSNASDSFAGCLGRLFNRNRNSEDSDSRYSSHPKEKVLQANEILANWVSPEVINGDDYTQPSDIYSFSLVLWEILAGVQPFGKIKHQEEIRTLIKSGGRPFVPDQWASPKHAWGKYVRLMKLGWHQDIKSRPTAKGMLEELEKLWRGCFHADTLMTDIIPDLSNEEKLMQKQQSQSIFNINRNANSKLTIDKVRVAYLAQPMQFDATYAFLDEEKELGYMIVSAEAPYYILRITKILCSALNVSNTEVVGKPLRDMLTETVDGNGLHPLMQADDVNFNEFCQKLERLANRSSCGWVEVSDPVTNKSYYWNQLTNRASLVEQKEGPSSISKDSTADFAVHHIIHLQTTSGPSLYSLHSFPIRQRTPIEVKESSRGVFSSNSFKSNDINKSSSNLLDKDYYAKHPVKLLAIQFSLLKGTGNSTTSSSSASSSSNVSSSKGSSLPMAFTSYMGKKNILRMNRSVLADKKAASELRHTVTASMSVGKAGDDDDDDDDDNNSIAIANDTMDGAFISILHSNNSKGNTRHLQHAVKHFDDIFHAELHA